MDNPSYYEQSQMQVGKGNYNTLGIPLVKSSSPSGPSSIQSAPLNAYNSLSSSGTSTQYSSAPPGMPGVQPPGVNGMMNGIGPGGPPRTPGAGSGSHPRSSAGEESDEPDYYNEIDRLKREMQPLHPNRTSNSNSPSSLQMPSGPSKHETTV